MALSHSVNSAEDALVWPKAIIHVDLDAFYASVEQLRHPELVGKPIIVGGGRNPDGSLDTSRSVVSTCSYEAREYGIKSAMPLSTALRLCPHAICVPVDMRAYKDFSTRVFEVVQNFTPIVEKVSVDEAYLDVTGSILSMGSPDSIAFTLKNAIWKATRLHASFGIATSKVVAKVASDFKKPQGFVVVAPGEEAQFLAPLPVRALPGVGSKTAEILEGLGVHTIGQIAKRPLPSLERRFGTAAGKRLWERAQGIDEEAVQKVEKARSISREATFNFDVDDFDELAKHAVTMSAQVGRSLRQSGERAKTVGIRLRFTDFSTITRQQTMPVAIDGDRQIAKAAINLLKEHWDGEQVRLFGVSVSGLGRQAQMDLFAGDIQHEGEVDQLLDLLYNRFGEAAPRRLVTHEEL